MVLCLGGLVVLEKRCHRYDCTLSQFSRNVIARDELVMTHGLSSAQCVATDTSFMAVKRVECDLCVLFVVYVAIVKGNLWRF